MSALDFSTPSGMRPLSPAEQIMRDAAERLARDHDAIVLNLVRDLLHDDALQPRDMHGRLECVTVIGDPYRTYMLDGRPIARFWPPEVTYPEPPGQKLMQINQRYEVLR